MQETQVQFLGWEDSWRMERLPIPVFWPGEFHGLYSPWRRKEPDMTERLSPDSQMGLSETLQSHLTLCFLLRDKIHPVLTCLVSPSALSLTLSPAKLPFSHPSLPLGGTLFKTQVQGRPCWLSSKESSCQCRGHRFNPRSGKIPHSKGPRSPCVPATEATRQSL